MKKFTKAELLDKVEDLLDLQEEDQLTTNCDEAYNKLREIRALVGKPVMNSDLLIIIRIPKKHVPIDFIASKMGDIISVDIGLSNDDSTYEFCTEDGGLIIDDVLED